MPPVRSLAPSLLGAARQVGQGRGLKRRLDLCAKILPMGMQRARFLIATLGQSKDAPAHRVSIPASLKYLGHVDRFCRTRQLIASTDALERANQFPLPQLPQNLPQEWHGNVQRRSHLSGAHKLPGWLASQVSHRLNGIARRSREQEFVPLQLVFVSTCDFARIRAPQSQVPFRFGRIGLLKL